MSIALANASIVSVSASLTTTALLYQLITHSSCRISSSISSTPTPTRSKLNILVSSSLIIHSLNDESAKLPFSAITIVCLLAG